MNKELEAFRKVQGKRCGYCPFNVEGMDGDECCNCDECDETIEKALKALEIIKDKKVDVPFIIENPEAENVFWYNSSFTGVLCEGWRMLSQEEYDLLREVLL